MLVLTRRKNERVRIGDDVYVSIRDIRGSQVRLAFEAPDHVEIAREELLRNFDEDYNSRATRSSS